MAAKKTAKEIQSDVMTLLQGSALTSLISGEVYHGGQRPPDSLTEDVIVTLTSGVPGQIQTGVVTINIYVPDIDPSDEGSFVADIQRCAVLESAAQEWVESLTPAVSDYRFRLQQTILTEQVPDVRQHSVVVTLQYEYID